MVIIGGYFHGISIYRNKDVITPLMDLRTQQYLIECFKPIENHLVNKLCDVSNIQSFEELYSLPRDSSKLMTLLGYGILHQDSEVPQGFKVRALYHDYRVNARYKAVVKGD